MLDAQAAKASAKPPDERALTNVRGFQKFINQTFAPGQEDISLNSQAAVFPLGGGTIMRSPHEDYLRFEWSLPKAVAPCCLNNLWNMSGLPMARYLQ